MSRVLAFDTSGTWCAVGLGDAGKLIAEDHEPMQRGQAEALLPLAERVLAEAGCDWGDLIALAVGIGPGNFTGIRISVAAARGLALGLGIPAVPLSTFELLRDDLETAGDELVIAEAPRGMAYAQPFRDGRPVDPPRLIDPSAPPGDLRRATLSVTGHRAAEIAGAYDANAAPSDLDDLPRRMVRLADWKLRQGHDLTIRPAPLYVRPADAAPPSDPPPVILP